MRKKSFIALGVILVFMISTVCLAETYDFPNMSRDELNEVIDIIKDEIKANHESSSAENSKVEDATKAFVEEKYGKENVDWAWIDYSYTKDWNFYTLKTHADIRKEDGGKAQYDVYSEVFAENDNYQVVYAMIGTEVILDQRNSISDPRVLKLLGIEQNSAVEETAEVTSEAASEAPADTAPAETEAAEEAVPVAKRGDKSEEARAVQEMLARLGYSVGTPDGSFGEKTETAVKKFQEDNGLTPDGVVTKALYDALKTAADAAPEPEEVISISARELYNQFDNNAIAAKETYKGKTVQVTGTIGSIDTDILGSPYVTLNADDYGFTSVQCYFSNDDTSVLAGLNTGQTVTIKGTCDEMSILNVVVKKCSVVG